MYETEFERLDALGKMTQTVVSGLLRHEPIAMELSTSFFDGNGPQNKRVFVKTAVAIASALVEEIKATANQPKE